MLPSKQPSPWYAPPQKDEPKFLQKLEELYKKWQSSPGFSSHSFAFITFLASIVIVAISGFLFAFTFWPNAFAITKLLAFVLGIAVALLGFWAVLHTVGNAAKAFLKPPAGQISAATGYFFLKDKHDTSDSHSGISAPELALQSFVQQVRAYAHEVNYLRGREQRADDRKPGSPDPADLLKRRWSEVVDSLNEFEIYLANAPAVVIENLVTKSPTQHMDVSQVFRDVADTFDTTWRRKGINIESAIVSPLKATANEALLRRLLVGPWRASAYFARRGTGVVFAAKAQGSQVLASWETNGLCVPESYIAVALNTELSLNERLERGMAVLSSDPSSSSSTFLGLLSFLSWIDLAKASGTNFELKNANDGFQIILRLS